MYRRLAALCLLVLLLSGCSSANEPTTTPPANSTALSSTTQASSSVIIPGQSTTSAAKSSTAQTSDTQLYVRDGIGTANDQLMIVKMPSGLTERKFPSGAVTADWSILYSSAINQERTTVTGTYLSSGTAFRTNTFNGRFALPQIDGGTRFGGLSRDGKTLVLEERLTDQQTKTFNDQKQWVSRFVVLDTSLQSPARFIDLEGSFAYDALSPDGQRLYLVEHLPPYNTGHYQVRLYEMALGKLNPQPVFDKGEQAIMEGYSGSQIASPKGDWVYTIYRNSEHGPFVHALNTLNSVAVCLDLPLAGKENEIAALRWSLALSSGGDTLYAVNPVLGQLTEINADWPQVKRSVGIPATLSSKQRPMAGTSSSILSPDAQTLFVLSGKGILVINTNTNTVRQQITLNATFDSLALNKEGTQLYAASAERQKVLVIDPASGATLAEFAATDRPWVLLKADVHP